MPIFSKLTFMNIHTGQRRPLPAVATVAVLLLLSLLVDQFWIARLFPSLSGILGIDLMVVFLDIPVHLPAPVDLIPVMALFSIFYLIVIRSFPFSTGRLARQEAWKDLRAALAGIFAVLACLLSGGLIFYLAQDYLPRKVRNGIDSFGISADIYIPFPGHETVQLRGSMLLLICFIIGMRICIRKIRRTSAPLMKEELVKIPTPPARREVLPTPADYQTLTVHEKLVRQEAIRLQEAMQQREEQARRYLMQQQEAARQEIIKQQEQEALCYSQPVQSVKPITYRSPTGYSRSTTS
jgi:hypothetical protein